MKRFWDSGERWDDRNRLLNILALRLCVVVMMP